MGKEAENITSSLKKSPQLVSLLLIVGGFIYYLIRHDEMQVKSQERDDLVAKQRIDRCHLNQARATEIMDKLNTSLNSQGNAFHELSVTLRDLRNVMSMHNTKMSLIISKFEKLEKKLEENGAKK
jgi:uncharacterized coiled-coil protein SlyX